MAVTTRSATAVAFKGRMMTLTVLEVRGRDLEAIDVAVAAHLKRAGDFFRGMPLLLSLADPALDLSALAAVLRAHQLVPVAVLGGDAKRAAGAGLGVIDDSRMPRERSGDAPPAQENHEPEQRKPAKPAATAATAANRGAARLINRPVRSGQQIYARDSDLVVTAAVSKGAELLADGHIHVYGALRGRALAGATGDTDARIFCQRFEPDLIAVAGCYKVADAFDEGLRGKAVQVRLEGENLIIELQETA